MAKVVILGTGGTIASRQHADESAVATNEAADLVSGVVTEHELVTRDVMTVGSYRLSLADLRTIAGAAAAAALEPRVDGVVVTHGTDTMEETAYLTSLAYAGEVPIVYTGAQFAADADAPDGIRNLREAVEFAAAPELRGTGVGIAFGGKLLSARRTRKAHTLAPSPFEGGVQIAGIRGAEVAFLATPRPEPQAIELGDRFDTTVVDVIVSYPGADTALFDLAAERGDAVVLAGSGVGNAGPGFAEAVARATARGVPVILASRVSEGSVTPVYGNGGGIDLVRAGAVLSYELDPFQARLLAAALLSTGGAAGFAERFRSHAR